jgi:hypothetical protein
MILQKAAGGTTADMSLSIHECEFAGSAEARKYFKLPLLAFRGRNRLMAA